MADFQFGSCTWAKQNANISRGGGRCSACQTDIIDISGLDQQEFEAIYSKADGEVCVRCDSGSFVRRGGWLRFATCLTIGVLPAASAYGQSGAPPPPPPAAEADADEWIGVIVEEAPVLVGGLDSLNAALVYPPDALALGIEGRVFVQFVVEADGTTSDHAVVRGLCESCDAEALRVVRLAEFEPGKQRGKPVAVRFTLPVVFRLSEE